MSSASCLARPLPSQGHSTRSMKDEPIAQGGASVGNSARKHATIFSLPNDVLLEVISFVHVKDILSLRKTSKRLYTLTKLRWVWDNAVKRQIIDKGLPVPANRIGIKKLTSAQIEARTIHAAQFHDNWHSERPKPRRAVEFVVEHPIGDEASELQSCPVDQLLFLRGRSGEYIVTLASGIITCWEVPLDGSGAYRLAEYKNTAAGEIKQVIVNSEEKNTVELACCIVNDRTESTVVQALSLDVFHGVFTVRSSILGTRIRCTPLYNMNNESIVMGDSVCIWYYNLKSSAGLPVVANYPSTGGEAHGQLLAVKLIGEYMLCVRQRSIMLTFLHPWSDETGGFKAPKPEPAQMVLHTGTEALEAVVIARSQSQSNLQGWPSDPVTILMRCIDGGFDLLRQYDIHPQPAVAPPSLSSDDASDDSRATTPEKVGHPLPCIFPSQFSRVRRISPSCCKLQVSQNGKGFWMETRNLNRKRCIFPARCLVGFDVLTSRNDESAEERERRSTRLAGTGLGEAAPNCDLHVCEEAVYARRCDMSEIMWRKYMLTCADLEDTVGRLAVGDRAGKVIVMDYV